ncbi:MAG: XrtA system polysaccharide deacetylase [Pseudomonadota bacterium]
MAPLSQKSNRTFALTIDVEDYFQVCAFSNVVNRSDWGRYPYRAGATTRRLLDLLDAHKARATFFVLGWIAARDPALVREIVARGHELASHGCNHEKVGALSPRAFAEDVRASKARLEDIGGVPVFGYRAPSFSISDATPFAYETLRAAGYAYSSSAHPIAHDHYGDPNGLRSIHHPIPRDPFIEAPVATVSLFGRRMSAAGGGWFRATPSAAARWLLERAANQLSGPAIFYLHPWEIDPTQPRIGNAPLKSRMRHYLNLKTTETKFQKLLAAFEWRALAPLLGLADQNAPINKPMKVAS